jgi:hypothetical protein
MTDQQKDTESTDPQGFLRLLKDLLAMELTSEQQEKLQKFITGQGYVILNNSKYTKEDLKDLFYSNN